MRIAGAIRFADGRGGDTPALLFDAAMSVRASTSRSRATLLEALEAAMWAADLDDGDDAARRHRSGGAGAAGADRRRDDGEFDVDRLRRAPDERSGWCGVVARRARWCTQEVRKPSSQPAVERDALERDRRAVDFENHSAVARERVRVAREQGALATLPVALSCLAWCERLAGRIDAADALVAEAIEIAAASGAPSMPGAQGIMSLAMLGAARPRAGGEGHGARRDQRGARAGRDWR